MKKYLMENKMLLGISIILSALFSLGSAWVALILRDITDIALTGDMDALVRTGLLSSVFFTVMGICYYLYSTASKKLMSRVIKKQRQDVMEGILKRNISDFREVNSADYISALTNDIKMVEENYLVPVFAVIQHMMTLLFSVGVMFYISPIVTLCLLVSTVLLMVIPGLFQGGLQKRQEAYSGKLSGLTVRAKDLLAGFEVIRSYGMHSFAGKSFAAENKEAADSKFKVDRYYALIEAISIVLGVVVQVGVLFFASYLIIRGTMTVGAMLGLISASGSVSVPIQSVSQSLPMIQGMKPIIGRLSQYAEYQSKIFTGAKEPHFDQSIEVKALEFGYEDGQKVIDQTSLKIEKNKKYAVLGKSGCGKTTLVNLLTGSYGGYTGSISYDGEEIGTLDISKLNELASVIHQNVYMFDGTVRDNICLHRQFTDKQISQALEASGADMFIQDKSMLNDPIGENGSLLSGGQRQRLAVARALIQKKPLLILDEGTSAIDRQTAYDIESKLLSQKDLTLLTITHNLDPKLLSAYDAIIYMENGKISETGTFDQLIANQNAFSRFYQIKEAA